MKLIKRDETSLVFELDRRECEVLGFLLRRYPLLDPRWHQITRPEGRAALAAEQEMLTEAMTAAQAENRQRVTAFIRQRLGGGSDDEADVTAAEPEGRAGAARPSRRTVALSWEEGDWLLQIINEVRVGSWVRLGSPDESAMHTPALAARGITDYTAMEIGGLVQSLLLEAMEPGSAGPPGDVP